MQLFKSRWRNDGTQIRHTRKASLREGPTLKSVEDWMRSGQHSGADGQEQLFIPRHQREHMFTGRLVLRITVSGDRATGVDQEVEMEK